MIRHVSMTQWNGPVGTVHLMPVMEVILNFLLITSYYLGEFSLLLLSQGKTSNLSVCSRPTHVDARTVNDKFSWLGTDAVLIYDTTPKPAAERNWAYGISRNFG